MTNGRRVRRIIAKRTALVLAAAVALVGVMATSGAATQPPPPVAVNKVSPNDRATWVLPASYVSATFVKAMQPTSINTNSFRLDKMNSDGTTTPVTAAVTYNRVKKQATLDPSADLEAGTYQATVTIGAKDTEGNQLDQNPNRDGNQPKIWTFTVRDTTPPTVTAVTPAGPRPGIHPEVPGTINPTATFSEEMRPESINPTTFTLVKQVGNVGIVSIKGTVTYDAASRTATFGPAADLEPGIYDARVTIGARDLAGNQLDQDPTKTGNQGKPWRFFVVGQ